MYTKSRGLLLVKITYYILLLLDLKGDKTNSIAEFEFFIRLFPQLFSAVNKKEAVFLLFIQQLFSSKFVHSFL
jgi:hypothetical protein